MEDEFLLIRKELIQTLDLDDEIQDENILNNIDNILLQDKYNYLELNKKLKLRKKLFNSIRKLDVLQELLEDESITEIMVNGYKNIFIEKAGKLSKCNKEFSSPEKLWDCIQQIVGKCNRVVNQSMPIVDARLENGSRINVVIPPVSLDGAILTIRKFSEKPITIEKLIELGSLTKECSEFLKKLVVEKYSILVSGGTGSGKTTFLGVLSNFIPKDERIITIEDSAELRIFGIENLVRLEAKMANDNNSKPISIRDLIKASLRMRPNRIVVGEVRGEEAIDMLQAMNTGHNGSMSTAHSNSCSDMLGRLETMVLMGMDFPIEAIRRQIFSGIDIIVHLGRFPNGDRGVIEIVELAQLKKGEIILNKIYERDKDNKLVKTGKLTRRQNEKP